MWSSKSSPNRVALRRSNTCYVSVFGPGAFRRAGGSDRSIRVWETVSVFPSVPVLVHLFVVPLITLSPRDSYDYG